MENPSFDPEKWLEFLHQSELDSLRDELDAAESKDEFVSSMRDRFPFITDEQRGILWDYFQDTFKFLKWL